MDTGQIDAKLQEYTAAEHRIGANLHELEDHSVYRLFTTGVLTGRTESAFRAAQQADPSLWDLFTLLSTTLERARSLRGTRSWVGGNERTELVDLLTRKEIVIKRDDVPLTERGLAGDSQAIQRMSIDGLMERMRALYEPLRDAISRADRVLDGLLPRLSAAEQTIQSLGADCSRLGVDDYDLRSITATIERIRELSLTDPLAIPADARSTLEQALHDAGVRIAEARASHDAIAHDLAAASDLLDRCRTLIAQAVADREQAMHKIVLQGSLPMAPNVNAIDGPKGLAAGLDDITDRQGPWQATRHLLDSWLLRARRFEAQLESVAGRIRAPLDRRAELRGRLSGFRAKMSGVGRSEDSGLRELSDEVHSELFTAPSDLDRAERLLAEFGSRLSGAGT